MKNKIIFLNGTSSSGKTSIVKEFQELTKECYYNMRMDTIYNILPEKYLIFRNHNEFRPALANKLTDDNRKGFYFEREKRCKLGEYAKCIANDFIDLIKILAQNERNIIVDFIAFGLSEFSYIADLLKKFDVYIVRIYCDPYELAKREKLRGDRIIGSAEYTQTLIDLKYNDYILNSTEKTPLELAKELYNFINNNKSASFKKLHEDNSIILKIDENVKLETKSLKYSKEITKLINKNKSFFKKSLAWLSDEKYTEKDSENYIKLSTYGQDFIKDFVIKYRNKTVGVIDFHEVESNEANIGYWLDEEMQGKGIMTKSCEKLIEYGFNILNLKKINLLCNINNKKSENIAKRLNMNFESVIANHENLYGTMLDYKKYSLIKK